MQTPNRAIEWEARGLTRMLAAGVVPVMVALIAYLAVAETPSGVMSAEAMHALYHAAVGLIALLTTYLCVSSYVRGGRFPELLLGCGTLALSAASLAASVYVPGASRDCPECSHAVFGLGAAISAAFHLAGALVANYRRDDDAFPRLRREHKAVLAYTLIFVMSAAIVRAAYAGYLSDGFASQVALGLAAVIYTVTGVLFLSVSVRQQHDFALWYALGLALTAIGLLAASLPVGDVDRLRDVGLLSLGLGGIYMLVAGTRAYENRQLRATQAQLGAVLDALSDALLLCDTSCVVTGVNSVAQRILGRGELPRGTTLLDLAPSSGRESEVEMLQSVLRGDAVPPWRMSRVGPNGEEHVFDMDLNAVRDRDGTVTGAVLIARDVTTQIAAQRVLAESEERYRQLFGHALDAVLLVDRETRRIIDANPAAEDLFGLSHQELLQRDIADLSGEPEKTVPGIASMAPSQAVRIAERRVRRSDGAELWTELVASSYTQGGRDVTCSIMRDITERKRAQEALARSEALHRMVAELTSDVAYGLSVAPNGMIASDWGVEGLMRLTGLSAEELSRGGGWLSSVHPQDLPVAHNHMGNVLAGNEDTAVFRVVRRDGSTVWVRDTTRPVIDECGRVVQVVGSTQDITAQLALEERLREVDKINAVGRLAGGVAHEFNNLLTIIDGYCEMVLSTLPADSPAREYSNEIHKASRRAADLTGQLLAFGRRQVMHVDEVNVNSMVTDLQSLVARTVGDDIHLALEMHSRPCLVRADVAQLQGVVLALASNAADAIRETGRADGMVTIRTSQASVVGERAEEIDLRPGQYVVLSVEDNGAGIAPEVRAHMFEPFYSTKPVGQGTGLGLATVYGTAMQLGGGVRLDTTEGVGTCLSVYLPAAAGVGQAVPAPRGGERVMVVEQDAALRDMVVRLLRRLGYEALPVADAAEALARVRDRSDQVDLVLVATELPGVTGTEMAARLRESRPDLAVRLMSTLLPSSPAGERQGDVLRKPFDIGTLADLVRSALDETERPDGAKGPADRQPVRPPSV